MELDYTGKVKEVLKTALPPKGRFEYIKSSSGVTAIVDYAHTPDALDNVLKTIQKMRKEGTRVISVFGCGGDRDPVKRSIMGQIGANLSDIAIFTSDNPRSEDPEKIIDQMKKDLSSCSVTFVFSRGLMKLGQPVPESNLSFELNKGSPETIST